MLISDEIDFKSTIVTSKRKTLHNEKGSIFQENSIYTCMCT